MKAENKGSDVYDIVDNRLITSCRRRGWCQLVIAVAIIAMVITFAAWRPAPLDVCVAMSWPDDSIIGDSVESGIINALSTTDRISVLPIESRHVASQAIEVSARRRENTYDVSLIWRMGGEVERAITYQVPAYQPSIAYSATISNIDRAYLFRGRKRHSVARPESYVKLMAIRYHREAGESLDGVLAELTELRTEHPSIDVCAEEIHTARYLWQSTHQYRYLQTAHDSAQVALSIAPSSPRVLSAVIELALSEDDIERATELVDRLGQSAPEYPYLPRQQAKVLELRGDLAGAEEWLRRGSLRGPRFELDLGRFLKRYGIAINESLRRLESAHRYIDTVDSLANLAEWHVMYGDPVEAEEMYRQAIEIGDRNHHRDWLATCLMLQRRFDEAIEIYQSLPDTRSRRLYLAECYRATGKIEATALLSSLARSQKEDAITAQAMAYLGDQRAVDMIRPATQLEWYALWRVKHELGIDMQKERRALKLASGWFDCCG